MLFKQLLISAILGLASFASLALPDVVAEYSNTQKKGFEKQSSSFSFARNQQQVITIYPQKQTAEYWQKRANGRHHFYRFFTADQRSVYYPPSDLSSLNIIRSWDSIENLHPLSWLSSLERVDSQTQTGKQVDFYRGTLADIYVELDWLPEYQLPQRILTKQGFKSHEIVLQSLKQDPAFIEQALAEWLSYPSIDYADVGDSENDPFLAKMIRQGFIEHAASGVYDSNGKVIQAAHSH